MDTVKLFVHTEYVYLFYASETNANWIKMSINSLHSEIKPESRLGVRHGRGEGCSKVHYCDSVCIQEIAVDREGMGY